ncbi:MAG: HEAT repeat domain-containing protein [Methanomicrobiaceae archaeon]|nr:HEAT repeat domain-containing protein [Methanomicrobiaceae archaeon]
MNLFDVEKLKKKGDLDGLLGALEDRDQYVRRNAASALCTFCDPGVAEVLARLKFSDPSQEVRNTASRGHATVVAALKGKKTR